MARSLRASGSWRESCHDARAAGNSTTSLGRAQPLLRAERPAATPVTLWFSRRRLRPRRPRPLPRRLQAPCPSTRLRQCAAPGHRRYPRNGAHRPRVCPPVRCQLAHLRHPLCLVHRRPHCVSICTNRTHFSDSSKGVVARKCGSGRLIAPSSRAVAFSGSHPRRLWAPFFQRGGVRGCEG